MINEWYNKTHGERTRDALRKNGFISEYFPERSAAIDYISNLMHKDMRIGFGGSVTTSELGLHEVAKHKGAEIIDHHHAELSDEERFLVMREQLLSDLFISSANAVTEKGEIVNVDHIGNRAAALIFGPRTKVVVIGANKIVADLDSAWKRIDREAAPKNNKRLNKPNPCVQTGYCVDCQGETRICRSYVAIKKRPAIGEFHVVIIGENLGL
ncbi:MAG TPA: lactate utilization protein [Spirochaetota bacterium]